MRHGGDMADAWMHGGGMAAHGRGVVEAWWRHDGDLVKT